MEEAPEPRRRCSVALLGVCDGNGFGLRLSADGVGAMGGAAGA